MAIDLSQLRPIGRKQWTKRQWDEYDKSPNTLAIRRAIAMYEDPTNEYWEGKIEKGKWKSTISKKVNYLLARPPVVDGLQKEYDEIAQIVKETATQYLLRGSLIWIVQGNDKDLDPVPQIMNDTIAIYGDEHKENPIAFIRRYVDIELEKSTGEEKEIEYLECYYLNGDIMVRDTFCYSFTRRDRTEILDTVPLFIELGKTGDAPLYAYVGEILRAFDNILRQQDATVESNTKPLVEVRGYSGTDDADLVYAINNLSIARTDGNGGVTVHTRQMDSQSVDIYMKRLLQEYYEITCTVGKENEIAFAVSGKAMDRLFVDAENSAVELGQILEGAIRLYFEYIGKGIVDIVWNTDRPVDDTEVIASLMQSRGLLSDKTLVQMHPWVDNPDEEMERIEAEQMSGIDESLFNFNGIHEPSI